ncbi:putative polyphosphate/ATP-dependent NAD kinase [Polymorphobacter multimanifer]|uniref:Putative polyphosphate/ATP-dependent NAD kinase n=3 Tax=Polymorphobacter multimanifer TaxID=1070431 RepID=A0A841L4Y0_9SPHN|nr:putative polyphosphate/ATP-dependent NAD kinase [Polymorphobacter multimanifer]
MRIGLIVNPVAGIGGPMGLAGSDGALGTLALARGGVAGAGARAALALQGCGHEVLTSAGAMGEDPVRAAGLVPQVVHRAAGPSGAADTVAAGAAMAAAGVELLVFAGGDGTATDLLGVDLPVLGVPAGVKMHSAVFGRSPRAVAAALAQLRPGFATRMAEVVDRDGDGRPQLLGALATPVLPGLVQPAKATAPQRHDAALAAACAAAAHAVRATPLAFIGCGSTMLAVKDRLAPGGTLLGVDAYGFGLPLVMNAREDELAALAAEMPPLVLLGVIGGQGVLLGRGNQQLSARVLRGARFQVLASAEKLMGLAMLSLDTGDPALDDALAGHWPVITAPRRSVIMPVVAV